MNTLVMLWEETERRCAAKTALIASDGRLTYRQAGERVRRLSATLAARWGTRPGETIALLAPNSAAFVIAYFAIVRLGAIVQPLDDRLRPEEMKALLADAEPSGLLVHHTLWPVAERIRVELPWLKRALAISGGLHDDPSQQGKHPAPELPVIQPSDVAELMYTSGTADAPKGVLRSHANARAASRNAIRGFGYRHDDVIAITMPLSHSSALSSQMLPLIELGGTLVLLERFDAGRLLDAIRREAVTCMRAVPAMLRSLLAAPRFRSEELPSLRCIANSSAAIDPQTFVALKRRFARIEVLNSYGLTEASTCTVLPDRIALIRPESIGAPIEGVEMRVVDPQGRDVPDGEEGEIWVRGEHVFVRYRRRPDTTRAALMDGWLRTGDLGRRDAEGFYYLHGRQDDLINCGGRKVNPLEVEHCILQLPEVVEVAVVGHPHRILGEVVKALVVSRPGQSLDPKRIIAHCARRLASHKVPFLVEPVCDLPRNSTGKTSRRRLRETAEIG